jgi:hypothetical protein
LIRYLYQNKHITFPFTNYDLIREIEKLRDGTYIVEKGDYNDINLLLSLIPTKYTLFMTMFSNSDSDYKQNYEYSSIFEYSYNDNHRNKLHNPNKVFGLEKITCKNNLFFSPFEWCMDSYKDIKDKINCPSANFYSGFYKELPPSLNIGILRQPSDLEITLKALEENKLINKLNISDYKPKVESDKFSNDVSRIINPKLLDDILCYSGVDEIITSINNLLINEYLHSALIWKALNYYGYDVNPDYFNKVKLPDNNQYRLFNDAVIKLANLDGWADHTFNIVIPFSEVF